MTQQLALNFDRPAARNARNQAIQQVSENANTNHRAACEQALTTVIERGAAFTTDDVIRELGAVYADIREPRLLGAVIRDAARTKRIVETGNFVTSARVANHGRTVREWVKSK